MDSLGEGNCQCGARRSLWLGQCGGHRGCESSDGSHDCFEPQDDMLDMLNEVSVHACRGLKELVWTYAAW